MLLMMKLSEKEQVLLNSVSELFGQKQHLTKQEKRKLQIVEAATDLFAKKGFDEVSFETIAARCKVSRPLISHYFKDKLDLFIVVARYIRIRFQKLVLTEMSSKSDAVSIYKAYVTASLRWHEDEPLQSRVWMLYYFMCGVNPKVKEDHTQLVNVGSLRIVGLLKSLSAENLSLEENALYDKAKLIQMLITGSLIREATEVSPPDQVKSLRQTAFLTCCQIAGV